MNQPSLTDAVYDLLMDNITTFVQPVQNQSMQNQPVQDRPTLSQNPQIEKMASGTAIPQRLYCQGNPIPHGAPGQQIMFEMADGGCSPAELALAGQCDLLVDRNSTVFADQTQTINMRIEWPGYAGWVAQIRVVDYRGVPKGITRAKLVEEIAKQLKNFIERTEPVPIDPNYAKYKVGKGGVELRHLHIEALERVSRGSWQPRLIYRG